MNFVAKIVVSVCLLVPALVGWLHADSRLTERQLRWMLFVNTLVGIGAIIAEGVLSG